MEELFKIILTSSLTIISGILIVVLGQIISKFYIDPVDDLRKSFGRIKDILTYYSNIYTNPGIGTHKIMRETSIELRKAATMLLAKKSVIRRYDFFVKLKWIPKGNDIDLVHTKLIFLSNSIFDGDSIKNYEAGEEVKKLLKLPQNP